MKQNLKGLISLLLISLSLSSCITSKSNQSDLSNSSLIDTLTSHSYLEVKDRIIDYSKMFTISDEEYLVYFYLTNCGHCQRIKDEVISFTISNIYPTYFILYDERINIGKDISLTLGMKDTSNFFIQGVPSIIRIKNKEIVDHLAGEKGILLLIKEIKENIY